MILLAIIVALVAVSLHFGGRILVASMVILGVASLYFCGLALALTIVYPGLVDPDPEHDWYWPDLYCLIYIAFAAATGIPALILFFVRRSRTRPPKYVRRSRPTFSNRRLVEHPPAVARSEAPAPDVTPPG